jgi:hypothetical protein
MSLYLLGLLVIEGDLWCPEEDVVLYILLFNYNYLFSI